ncbi:MAG: membrane protein insertase YidC, partial [Pseudomonadota bacterium]
MSTEHIRPMLIVALCFVLLLMWQAWQQDYGRQTTEPPATTVTTEDGTVVQADVPDVPVADTPSADGTVSLDTPVPVDENVAPAAVTVRTDTLLAEIDDTGTLSRVKLLQYPISLENQSPFELMAPTPPSVFTAQTGLLGKAFAPNHHAKFRAAKSEYVLGDATDALEIILTPVEPADDGPQIVKYYRFRRDSYLIDVGYRVDNVADAPWTGRVYGQFRRNPDESQRPGFFGGVYTYTGGVISSPEKPYEKVDFGDMEEEPLNRTVIGGWVAMIQHYFAGAWVPPPDASMNFYSKALGQGNYAIGLIAPPVTVPAGANESIGLKVFVGPKIQERLGAAAPGLDRTVDYGW